MTFSSSVTDQTVFGDKRIVIGTFTNGATDTGGVFTHGLNKLDHVSFVVSGTATVSATAPTVQEDLQSGLAQPTATLITSQGLSGTFLAIGR